jgi:PAS domain S-box-containing protein
MKMHTGAQVSRSDSSGLEGRFEGADPILRMLAALPTAIILVDASGIVVFVNAATEATFGYSSVELIGRRVERLAPRRLRACHRSRRRELLKSDDDRCMSQRIESCGLRKDGSEIPIEIGLKSLTIAGSRFMLGSVIDISTHRESMECLRQRMADLTVKFDQRGALLQIVHDRVTNNLQIVASLLNMHVRQLDPSRARDVLRECRTCIDGIALIHSRLYQTKEFSSIPFGDYARSLIATILDAWAAPGGERVNVRLDVQTVLLPVGRAIVCGLIVNELVTNAIKHAFPMQRHGTIGVSLESSENTVRLQVSDDGIGMHLPEVEDARFLGLRLVASLVARLNGLLDIRASEGVTATVEFPLYL